MKRRWIIQARPTPGGWGDFERAFTRWGARRLQRAATRAARDPRVHGIWAFRIVDSREVQQ